MSLNQARRRAGRLVERTGSEILIYSAGESSGAIHALNPTAALIRDICDGSHTLAEIERAVRQALSIPAGRDLTTDVRETVTDANSLYWRRAGVLSGGLSPPASSPCFAWDRTVAG